MNTGAILFVYHAWLCYMHSWHCRNIRFPQPCKNELRESIYKQISFVTESPRVRLNERVFTVNISANFSTGRMLCERQGGDLLILDNLAKDWAQLRLQPAVSGQYWIGLRGRQLCASGKASYKY